MEGKGGRKEGRKEGREQARRESESESESASANLGAATPLGGYVLRKDPRIVHVTEDLCGLGDKSWVFTETTPPNQTHARS